MFKKYAKTLIITSIITLSPIVVGLMLWDKLPDSIPMHFNTAGEVDGWGSKAAVVFYLPLFMVAISFLALFATAADPKHKNINDKALSLALWVIPAVSILCSTMSYSAALGKEVNVNTVVPTFMGLMFIVIGNYLPKCKQSYTVGIKLPWTLNDTENWNSTHRFSGWLWMVCGAVFAVSGLLNIPVLGIAAMIIMAAAPIVYSYLYYIKHK